MFHSCFSGDYICSRKVSTIACIHKPDCIPPDCNKHGKCHMGECICDRQWVGPECDRPLCKINNCSSNGVCTEGNKPQNALTKKTFEN